MFSGFRSITSDASSLVVTRPVDRIISMVLDADHGLRLAYMAGPIRGMHERHGREVLGSPHSGQPRSNTYTYP
jgi:hypothetical protein